MAISSSSLTTTPTPVFTSTGVNVISAAYYCNIDQNNSQTVSVWLVPSGGAPDATNIIYNNVHIVASDTLIIDREKVVLDNGDMIYANCSANISVTISSFGQ
jgi:hypothetical protein